MREAAALLCVLLMLRMLLPYRSGSVRNPLPDPPPPKPAPPPAPPARR